MTPMAARDAWLVLGKDPEAVFRRLAGLPRGERVSAARADLAEARKLAKALMAAHHPDRGGDADKFRMVNSAMISIESHTEDFARKVREADEEAERRQERRPVFIKLG